MKLSTLQWMQKQQERLNEEVRTLIDNGDLFTGLDVTEIYEIYVDGVVRVTVEVCDRDGHNHEYPYPRLSARIPLEKFASLTEEPESEEAAASFPVNRAAIMQASERKKLPYNERQRQQALGRLDERLDEACEDIDVPNISLSDFVRASDQRGVEDAEEEEGLPVTLEGVSEGEIREAHRRARELHREILEEEAQAQNERARSHTDLSELWPSAPEIPSD
jgi:hypothetical protein